MEFDSEDDADRYSAATILAMLSLRIFREIELVPLNVKREGLWNKARDQANYEQSSSDPTFGYRDNLSILRKDTRT
jgi:hypothetical protein